MEHQEHEVQFFFLLNSCRRLLGDFYNWFQVQAIDVATPKVNAASLFFLNVTETRYKEHFVSP